MTILSILYTFIITPLELLFEVIFSIANRLTGNAGLSIIFLSLAVNFLVLPLYKRADELQAEERDIQAKMAHWLKHIKTTFKGDERFFMIQVYYRLNHYKPVYALRSSVSVLLQIPFFIAAYNLLSGMQGLQGMSFGFISNLGKEDAMFMVGNFPINVLPILMTLINIVSGIIYTKGHPLKEKIQVYGLAAVFLVLLYRSPAGLVFYWLLNNVFSLVKNVFYKLKDPKKALNILLALAGAVVFISSLIRTDLDARQKVLLSVGGILLILPSAKSLSNKTNKTKIPSKANSKGPFIAGTVLMALITGILIPSSIIGASTLEFVDSVQLSNPILYVVNSMLISSGCWILWGSVFYFFANETAKNLFGKAIWIICGISLIDYLLFGRNLGTISSTLQYDKMPSFSPAEYLINIFIVLFVAAGLYFLYNKGSKIPGLLLCVGILAVTCVGLLNSLGILGTYSGYWSYWSNSKPSIERPSLPLSKNGKNVVVLMLDRALGTQVPYIFNEKPELKDKFDGFTYYPNTISYGPCTIVGAPALFGGYEYSPEKLAERNTETMADKHDESLKVMPVLFNNNGYTVTVCDPPYAGYKSYPDTTIYSDYPGISCYTTTGALNYLDWDGNSETHTNPIGRINELRNRNFFMLALMKISPLILQETIYDGGLFNEAVSVSGDASVFSINQSNVSVSKSTGYSIYFLNDYAVLKNLSALTDLSVNSNTFTMMALNSTHSPCLLQAPDYVPSANVDNTDYISRISSCYTIGGKTMRMTNVDQVTHYHVNIATYIQLGEWFDYLRKEGVYDNTRIILVADHGRNLNQFDIENNGLNLECFMPLLMVKDFNAKGFSVNEEFMTNADTPVLATAGLINNPVNPFTGNPLTSKAKNGTQTLLYTEEWNPSDKHIYNFPPSAHYAFSGKEPFSADKWKYLGEW